MDAVGAAVIIRESAVHLSLDVVQLQLGGALWWRKHRVIAEITHKDAPAQTDWSLDSGGTFERRDHARTPLLQEALQLLPGSLQHRVVLDVAAQVPVVLPEEAVPGGTAQQPVRTGHQGKKRFRLTFDSSNCKLHHK